MLQLHNSSPFAAKMLGLADPRGVATLFVVIKASFRIGQCGGHGGVSLEVAAEQQPVTIGDEHWGEPGASSLRYPSEAHPLKPGTDVLVLGDACAVDGQPVTELELAVQIAGQRKRARVVGDRSWIEGIGGVQPSRPSPFVRMPIVWERAYGGRDPSQGEDATFAAEPRNPVGVGFLGSRRPSELVGQPVPNIEDPAQALTRLGQTPTPTGFGPLAATWQPRVALAGTYDARWTKTRAPHLPHDFDPRFFNTAPAGLWFAENLRGGEPFASVGFHPRGPLGFNLPSCRFDIEASISGTCEPLVPALETVVLEPSEERLTMTWRASRAVDKKVLQVDHVDIGLAQLQGASEPGAVSA